MALKNEFQYDMAQYSVITAIIGFEMGTTIETKNLWLVQPSTKAASCSSLGMLEVKKDLAMIIL